MARNDPPTPGAADDPGAFEAPEDTLRRLHDRLDRAADATERLISEAAAQSAARAARAAQRPPAAGWQVPASDQGPGRHGGDLDLLLQLLDSLRELVPAELQTRLAEAARELLIALRALIDWYLERLDRHRDEPVEVQDIPISWE